MIHGCGEKELEDGSCLQILFQEINLKKIKSLPSVYITAYSRPGTDICIGLKCTCRIPSNPKSITD